LGGIPVQVTKKDAATRKEEGEGVLRRRERKTQVGLKKNAVMSIYS